MTKVVNRFGILENTIAKDLGSVVETKNEAYDAQSGNVLLTKTITNYDDHIYSMSIPAYWFYNEMGQAYKNIGVKMDVNFNSNGQFSTANSHLFVPGDELAVTPANYKLWVTAVDGNSVTVQDKQGNSPVIGSATVEVIRSGRKNKQAELMASMTSIGGSDGTFVVDPLANFQENIFENVVQASAIEYDDQWRIFCDCNGTSAVNSTNPYVMGTKGNYKPVRSHTHLTGRTQSDYNNNTNIRKDGVMESYTPFYQLNGAGNWEINRANWTYTSEITEFNPYGQELENKDALGRHSSAQFGFNQTLPKAVAANSKYSDMGFTSFEDEGFSDCADNHFKFFAVDLVDNQSHTGRNSVRVTSQTPAILEKDIDDCPDLECELSLNIVDYPVTNQNGCKLDVSAIAGSNSQFSYDVISGNPTFSLLNDGLSVQVFFENFSAIITVTDETGTCEKAVHVYSTNGGKGFDWELINSNYTPTQP